MPFERPTAEQWRALVEQDLKGADFDRKLVWHTLEGIPVQPLYTRADLQGFTPLGSGRWQIRQAVPTEAASEVLRRGAEAVCLEFAADATAEQIACVLSPIGAGSAELVLDAGNNWLAAGEGWVQAAPAAAHLKGSIWCDPVLATMAKPGELGQAMERAGRLLELMAAQPGVRTLTMDGRPYHEAGASVVAELAFALASGVESLRRLPATIEELTARMELHLSVSTNIPMELAKVRAARRLWGQILEAFDAAAGELHIELRSSGRDKGTLDPHTNLIRTAVEAFVGAVSGCDSLCIDEFAPRGEFSRRLARNQQLLLRDEAGLDRVRDPAAGSYLIEHLTDQVGRAAWELLQRVEAAGGMAAALAAGWPQAEIAESAASLQQQIRQGTTALVGVSRYADPSQTTTDWHRADEKVDGLPRLRLAAPFEALRRRAQGYCERTGHPPRALALSLGSPSASRARAAFSAGFLAAGGFQVTSPPAFADVESGARFAREDGAPVVVVCSSDREYPGLVAGLAPSLADRCLVVAGPPSPQVTGAELFVHAGSDRIQALEFLLERAERISRGGVPS